MVKHSNLIGGLFWLAIGILLSLWSSRYEVGSLVQAGPGLLPLGLGILLVFLSLILLVQALRASTAVQVTAAISLPGHWKRVAYTVLVLLLATFLFEKIGYLITLFLMIFFLMCGSKPRNWQTVLLVAFFSAVGVYLVFVLLLKQPLPRGPLGPLYGLFS